MLLDRTISVQLEQFDGPLSLLLYLIQKEEMSLETLDLTQITKQYLDFLKYMQELDFDMAGEYLYLAATLVWLKSKLSVEEKAIMPEGDDSLNPMQIASQDELVKRLKALQCFQNMSKKFWNDTLKTGDEIFLRAKLEKKKLFGQVLKPVEQNDMISVMIDLLKRQRRKFAVVKRDRLSIKEKLKELCQQMQIDQRYEMSQLIKDKNNIIDVVITFISLLELARLKKLSLMQAEQNTEIYVDVIGNLNNFDVESATGFDSEEEVKKDETDAVMPPVAEDQDGTSRIYQ